jgi:hypothetical protein
MSAARTARRAPTTRARRTRPVPRRVSGPAKPRSLRVAAGGAVALPRPGANRRGSTGVFERLRALPDHRLVDGVLRGRVWIWLIGIGLGGIVAMQVSLLKLNAGISRAVESSGTLERQNAELEASIARLSSGERIRGASAKRGMITPSAGDVEYVRVRPGGRDAARAIARMTAPSSAARELMANGGRPSSELGVPAAAAAAPATGIAPAAPAAQAPVATPAPAPVAPQPDPTTTQAAPAATAPVAPG